MTTDSHHKMFTLSFQMLIDDFEDHFPYLDFYLGDYPGKLLGVRVLDGSADLQPQYVYIADAATFPQALPEDGPFCFILTSEAPGLLRGGLHSFIRMPEGISLSTVFNIATRTFERYLQWDRELQMALSRNAGVLELFEISYKLFRNPLFIHDAHFYVSACPVQLPNMLTWELDERTGELMVPLDLIHHFKMDREYIHTLSTRGAKIFSESIRGYRILYINLWHQGRYEGRICINEIQNAIKKGHFIALEYFADVIQNAFHRRNMEPNSFYRSFDNSLIDILEERLTDEEIIAKRISYTDWALQDNYIVMVIDIAARDTDNLAAVGVCNHVEILIQQSYAFLYHGNIFILANLTAGKTEVKECVSRLADILRDGYYKMGVSETHNHIAHIRLAYRQAETALAYGKRSDSMVWYYYFSDYALDYLIDYACHSGKMDFFCCEGLFRLLAYDQENSASLFETLRVYLETERSAVKTAKALYIHRSTLLYRLKRIEQIAGFDLDNPKVRLHVHLSILLIEQEKRQPIGPVDCPP